MIGRFGVVHRSSTAVALLGRSATLRCTRRPAPRARFIVSTTNRWLSTDRSVALSQGSQITIGKTQEGRPVHRTFPNLWLRDNCQCTQCVNQDTRQRNFDTFQLSEDIHPVNFSQTQENLEGRILTRANTHGHGWRVRLMADMLNSLGKTSELNDAVPNVACPRPEPSSTRSLWSSNVEDSPPEVPFDAIMSESDGTGIADLTKNIWVHGFSFIVGTPPTPEATEAVLSKIGPIRTTHYGGFYDFIPDLALADTAYTNLALPAHTDTTYFTEPAGLQAFHLLSHTAPPNAKPTDDALGGQSLLVDGFNAAAILKKEFPDAYEILRTTRIPMHASGNEGIAIVPDQTYPVIEQDGDVLTKVRWNNDDRGILPLFEASKWYNAARKWNSILKRRTSEYWFQLTPGRVVVFDNWRVLHGRAGFEGIRRICGAYIPRDDFMSRYRATNFPHETVIGRNLNMRSRFSPPRDQREEAAITQAP